MIENRSGCFTKEGCIPPVIRGAGNATEIIASGCIAATFLALYNRNEAEAMDTTALATVLILHQLVVR